MKEWSNREFTAMLRKNGFTLIKKRGKGTHSIYQNIKGQHITVPQNIAAPVAKRLIKENNLNINL